MLVRVTDTATGNVCFVSPDELPDLLRRDRHPVTVEKVYADVGDVRRRAQILAAKAKHPSTFGGAA